MSPFKKVVALLVSIFTLVITYSRHQDKGRDLPLHLKDKSTALVLGSGGYLGLLWHLKTINELESKGILRRENLSTIIGTSGGAIAGLLYADSQLSITEIKKLANGEVVEHNGEKLQLNINLVTHNKKVSEHVDPRKNQLLKKYLSSYIKRFPIIPRFLPSLLSILGPGENQLLDFQEILTHLTKNQWPTMPLNINVFDLSSGQRRILHEQNYLSPVTACLDSSCFPGLFTQINQDSNYIDGGVFSALNMEYLFKLKNIKEIIILHPMANKQVFKKGEGLYSLILKPYLQTQNLNLYYYRIKAKLYGKKIIIKKPTEAEILVMRNGQFMEFTYGPTLLEV